MSTVTADRKIPEVIVSRIRALRHKLTWWLIIDGLSRLALAIVLLALFDAVIDRVFKMDGPQRIIMLCLMSAVLLGILFWRVLRPLFQTISDDAIILQVEKNNLELKEGLISSVQFARDGVIEKQGVSPQMVQATIDRGSEMARSLDFGKSLNGSRQGTNLILLCLGLAGIGLLAFGVANTDFWKTWFNRNILLMNDQWPQNTYLIIEGVVDGKKVMKRGEDHLQIVRVDLARSLVKEVDVTIETNSQTGRIPQKMRRNSTHEHQYDFRNVTKPFKFRVRGGDDISPWVQVELVDPPGIAELTLTATLPAYTGSIVEEFPRGSGPHSVAEGSSLSLNAVSNKPLGRASIKHEESESIPLKMLDDTHFSLEIPADKLVGGKYTFDLEDQSGLTSSRPTSFHLKIRPDREPQVRATLDGISGMVVPHALIPVSFTAKDEFAVTSAEYYLYWLGDTDASVKQEFTAPVAGIQEKLGKPSLENQAVYDLRDLKIPLDVGLRFRVRATDNNTLTGPGVGESREFLLRVVSEEVLRADLLRREIEQRQAFEFALKNQEQLTVDLRALAAAQMEKHVPDEAVTKLMEMQRRQKVIGTNLNGISDRFEAFLIEARYNRLDESASEIDKNRSIERRLNDEIIVPIRSLDENEILIASKRFDEIRRTAMEDNPDAMNQSATETADFQELIQEKMRAILASMEDSEDYQKAINLAVEIKRDEEATKKALDKKRSEGQADIFDDDGGGVFDDMPEDKTDDDKKADEKADTDADKKKKDQSGDGEYEDGEK